MAELAFHDRFWRDDSGLVSDDGDFPVPIQDLLDVAVQAYMKDREERRGPAGDPEWSRSLELEIAVRRPVVWGRPDVRQCLEDLLAWMTGDAWNVRVSRSTAKPRPQQSKLPLDPLVDDVALFSGGLDATAGVALRMASGRSVLAVGVATNTAMRGYQRRTYEALSEARVGRIRYVQVPLESRTRSRHDESSRRTRGFVFLAVGIAAAIAAGRDELLMLENGIGAINLPYTASQWGAMTSRSAHPKTLLLLERLVGLTIDRPVTIRNPHLMHTKGQMCARLPVWARSAVGSSESCDNAAAGRGALDRRCGECTSCILRRLSLSAARRSEWDGRPYRSVLRGNTEDRDRTPEMLWQAALIANATRRPGGLEEEYPQLRELPNFDAQKSEVLSLYRTYLSEWREYPDARVEMFLGAQSVRS